MNSNELFKSIRKYHDSGMASQELETKLWEQFGCRRAVMVMDSTGFTRVTKTHGIAHYLLTISRLREIVDEALVRCGCLTSSARADNVYAQFENPNDALNAALATNQALLDKGLMLTDTEPFTVCTGIGFGDLLDSETEGLYGSEMNLASKLGEDIAEGREILLTESAFQALPREKQSVFEEDITDSPTNLSHITGHIGVKRHIRRRHPVA